MLRRLSGKSPRSLPHQATRIRVGSPSRRAVWAISVLLAASLVTACSTSGESGTQKSNGGANSKIVVALDSDVNLIEPHTFRTLSAYAVTQGLYASPFRQVLEKQSDGLLVGTDKVVGGLVKDANISADGKTVTLTIKDGAKFDNGDPVTAEDLAWTFERAIKGPGYVNGLLPFIGLSSADQLKIVDARTLVLNPSVASPLLERFLTFQIFGPLNKKVAEQKATADDPWAFKWYATHATASGPYKPSTYDQGRQVVLVPNTGYPDAKEVANIGVTVRNVPDANQRALLLQRGEVDLATGLPPLQLKQMENNEAIRIYKAPSTRLVYLGLNNKMAPFDNVKVRQAIAYAVPYDALIKEVMSGYASPAGNVVTSAMKTYAGEEVGTYATNVDRAKQLLQESGVAVPPITLTVRQSRSQDQQAAVFIQDNLRKVGIDVNVVKLPDADFSSQLNKKQLQMFIHDWFSWGEDPFYQMQFLVTSKAFTNFSQYSNPSLDTLVKEGTFELDQAKRAEISKRAQALLFQDSPIVPLYAPNWVVAARANVTGVAKDLTEIVRLDTLSKS